MAYVVDIKKRGYFEVREKQKKPDGSFKPVIIKTFLNREEADAFVAQHRLKASRTHKATLASGKVPFKQAFQDYKTEVLIAQKGYGEKHQTMYVVNRFLNDATLGFLTEKQLIALSFDDVDEYIALREEEEDVVASTINRELNILSPFFNWCRKTFKMLHWDNPVEHCSRPKNDDERDRILTDKERATVEKVCKLSEQPVLHSAFVLAMETAVRRGEMAKIKWADVHIDNPAAPFITLRKETTKTKKARAVPLSPIALEAVKNLLVWREERMAREDELRKHRKAHDVYDFSFLLAGTSPRAISQAFRRAMARCAVLDFRWHDCRHCATTKLAESFEMLELSQITGHKDVRMLQRYYNPHGAKLAAKLHRKLAEADA